MFNQEKLYHLIINSDLSKAEAVELINVLTELPEADLVLITETFTESPELISIIYNNYQAKVSAFANNDSDKLDKILQQEIEIIASK